MIRNDDFSRLEINLSGCLDNYKYFRSRLEASTKLLVLVKANAYGHGAVQFASLMEEAGAKQLAEIYLEMLQVSLDEIQQFYEVIQQFRKYELEP